MSVLLLEKQHWQRENSSDVYRQCSPLPPFTGQSIIFVRSGTVLPEDTSLSFVGQLMSALEIMHAQGIAHRNVKLANLLVAGSETIQLALSRNRRCSSVAYATFCATDRRDCFHSRSELYRLEKTRETLHRHPRGTCRKLTYIHTLCDSSRVRSICTC